MYYVHVHMALLLTAPLQVGKVHWSYGTAVIEASMMPSKRGFDTALGSIGNPHDHYVKPRSTDMKTDPPRCGRPRIPGLKKLELYDFWNTTEPAYDLLKYPPTTYCTTVYLDEIDRVLTRRTNFTKRVFLFITPTPGHTPIQAPDHLISQYIQRGTVSRNFAEFNAMFTAVDQLVNDTVQRFKNLELWNETLLVYASDNGGLTCAGGSNGGVYGSATNYPLRGGKKGMFEGGIRSDIFLCSVTFPFPRLPQLRQCYWVYLSPFYTLRTLHSLLSV